LPHPGRGIPEEPHEGLRVIIPESDDYEMEATLLFDPEFKWWVASASSSEDWQYPHITFEIV
jgi:hypothetical protein